MLRTSLLEVAGKIAEARESAQANALRLAQLALECCPEPIFICDLRGVPLLMNAAYVELFGEDALQVRNMNDLVGLNTNPDMVRSIAAALRDGADSWHGEEMLRCATGEVIPVAVSVTRVYDKNNVPVGFIGLHRDLREQRRAAQERLELERHKQELAHLESLAVLAGGVGHDFNNLLTTIFYYGHLLDNYLSEEPAKQALQRIMQASRHAADLCRQLMAYAGRAPTHMQAVDMPAVIRDTVALVQGNLHAEHRIELDIADDLPPIIGDIVQLRQAVSNLLINASEAIGPKPGTITVGLCLAHSQSQDAPWCHRFVGTAHYQLGSLPPLRSCLMLCVHDTGCGMSQATMDRIFEPFYSTKAGGRGLGLANVVGAIRSHHGKLEISSTLGQGTLMRLWFPIVQPTAHANANHHVNAQPHALAHAGPQVMPHSIAPGHSQATPSSPPRGRVLIADDEESIRELLANYLTVRGFQVQTTQTGPELLQLYRDRTEPVRLVIVDQQLPEMNGTTVAGQLAALDPTVPVLLISGYDLDPEQLRREIGSAQTLDFLRKPFTMRELDEQLKRMLTEKR
jgi:two-component system cell cycle sensor histidine kinase/response regulator CckA